MGRCYLSIRNRKDSEKTAWNYSEKTQQLYMDAVEGKRGTHLGEIEDPDGLGEHGSIACGDALRFTFAVERHPTDPAKDVITEAKYLTFGAPRRSRPRRRSARSSNRVPIRPSKPSRSRTRTSSPSWKGFPTRRSTAR